MKTNTENKEFLKYVSLVTLTAQNAMLGLSMRYARTRPGELFFDTTAVLMAEVVKLMTCLYLVFRDEGSNVGQFVHKLHSVIIKNKVDTFKVTSILSLHMIIYLVYNIYL